ncbi:MAG: hypothetical protein AAGA23_10525 [Pseudomonadota bacterium]
MAGEPSLADFSPVFGSEDAADARRVLDALDARRIPNYGRRLGPGEGQTAPMPPYPENAPGIVWEVMVPDRFHRRARLVIRGLALKNGPEPETLRDAPDQLARRTSGAAKWILVVLLFAAAVRQLTRLI